MTCSSILKLIVTSNILGADLSSRCNVEERPRPLAFFPGSISQHRLEPFVRCSRNQKRYLATLYNIHFKINTVSSIGSTASRSRSDVSAIKQTVCHLPVFLLIDLEPTVLRPTAAILSFRWTLCPAERWTHQTETFLPLGTAALIFFESSFNYTKADISTLLIFVSHEAFVTIRFPIESKKPNVTLEYRNWTVTAFGEDVSLHLWGNSRLLVRNQNHIDANTFQCLKAFSSYSPNIR